MVVVPDQGDVVAEVVFENKDIGFIRPGQDVAVKLDTFNFTKYGTIPAKVQRVASDAVNDEKRGPIFPATVRLEKAQIEVDGRMVNLAPGMAVVAEVKTGRRRVIEYLITPLTRRVDEAFGER